MNEAIVGEVIAAAVVSSSGLVDSLVMPPLKSDAVVSVRSPNSIVVVAV